MKTPPFWKTFTFIALILWRKRSKARALKQKGTF